jgi:FMN phosphatase YigB (HAD superfamily)
MRPWIFFDLDGVLRDLSGAVFGSDPEDWNVDLVERVNQDLGLLVRAEATEYVLAFFSFYGESVIVSNQPPHWRRYTMQWIVRNLSPFIPEVIFVDHMKQKLNLIGDQDILVDDFPFFDRKLDHIILVKHKYNERTAHRFKYVVSNEVELNRILNDLAKRRINENK